MGADWYDIRIVSGVGIIFIGMEIPSKIADRYNIISYVFPLNGEDPAKDELCATKNRTDSIDYESERVREFEEELKGREEREIQNPKLDPYIQFDRLFAGANKTKFFCDEIKLNYVKPYYVHILPVTTPVVLNERFCGSYDCLIRNNVLKYAQVDYPAVFPKRLEPYVLALPEHKGFTEKLNKDRVHYFSCISEIDVL